MNSSPPIASLLASRTPGENASRIPVERYVLIAMCGSLTTRRWRKGDSNCRSRREGEAVPTSGGSELHPFNMPVGSRDGDRGLQVRTRLTAGGRWIRTLGPPARGQRSSRLPVQLSGALLDRPRSGLRPARSSMTVGPLLLFRFAAFRAGSSRTRFGGRALTNPGGAEREAGSRVPDGYTARPAGRIR
jgi:hypothetical protein